MSPHSALSARIRRMVPTMPVYCSTARMGYRSTNGRVSEIKSDHRLMRTSKDFSERRQRCPRGRSHLLPMWRKLIGKYRLILWTGTTLELKFVPVMLCTNLQWVRSAYHQLHAIGRERAALSVDIHSASQLVLHTPGIF